MIIRQKASSNAGEMTSIPSSTRIYSRKLKLTKMKLRNKASVPMIPAAAVMAIE